MRNGSSDTTQHKQTFQHVLLIYPESSDCYCIYIDMHGTILILNSFASQSFLYLSLDV